MSREVVYSFLATRCQQGRNAYDLSVYVAGRLELLRIDKFTNFQLKRQGLDPTVHMQFEFLENSKPFGLGVRLKVGTQTAKKRPSSGTWQFSRVGRFSYIVRRTQTV